MTTTRLHQLAALVRVNTLECCKDVLRSAGEQVKHAHELQATAQAHAAVHSQRTTQRAPWARQRRPIMGRLYTGALGDRLVARTRAAVETVSSCIRTASLTISISAQPSYAVRSDLDWTKYQQHRSYGYPETIYHQTLTVRRDWLRTVYRRGLATLDGVLTLSAERLDLHGEVYAAQWLEQGRGYNCRVVSGCIAIDGNHRYHAESRSGETVVDTARRAIAGVARKVRALDNPTPRRSYTPAEITARLDHRCSRMIERNPNGVVLLERVRRYACESGIRSWCYCVGLGDAYQAGRATVAELAAGYRAYPLPEVRRAIVSAR